MDDFEFENHCHWYEENLRVVDRTGKVVPFKLYPVQKKLERLVVEAFEQKKPCFIIVLKARREGISTWVSARFYRDSKEMEHRRSMILAHDDKATKNVLDMVRFFFNNDPDKPETTKDSQAVLKFKDNASEFMVYTAGSRAKAGRSFNAQAIHISELDFWDDPRTFTSVMQVTPNTFPVVVIIESTAQGPEGPMQKLWDPAVEGRNGFTPVFFAWFDFEEYRRDLSWDDLLSFADRNWVAKNRDFVKLAVRKHVNAVNENKNYWRKKRRKEAENGLGEGAGTAGGPERDGDGTPLQGGAGSGGAAAAAGGEGGPGDQVRLAGGEVEGEGAGGGGRIPPVPIGWQTRLRQGFAEEGRGRASTAGMRRKRNVKNLAEAAKKAGIYKAKNEDILWDAFQDSLTPYEQGLMTEFPTQVTFEAINWLRWVTAVKCNGDEIERKREYPCIAEGEPVIVPEGIVAIEKVVPDGRVVVSRQDSGVQEAFVVRTTLGYEVTCTWHHKLKTPDGFVELADLPVGATVLLGSGSPSESALQSVAYNPTPFAHATIPITERFAEFLGLYMGDGSFHRNVVSIVCDRQDEDLASRVDALMTEFLGKPTARIVGTKGGGVELRSANVRLEPAFAALDLLRQNGAFQWKRKVHVPDYINKSPLAVQRAFLRGLFEADGFVARDGSGVKFFTKYEKFARDVQVLLMRHGISCRRSRHDKKTSGGHRYVGWELTLRTAESVLFAEKVGFLSDRKRGRMALAKDRPAGGRRPIADTDTIASIEPVGPRPVYDIGTVNYEFSCGGIVVHNSRPSESFEAAAETVLDPVIIAKWTKWAKENPPEKIRFEVTEDRFGRVTASAVADPVGHVCIWERPIEGENYVMGVDPSTGSKEGDWTVGSVLSVSTGHQVAEFRARMDPDLAIDQIEALGVFYNSAFTGVEANTYGIPFVRALEDRGTLPMFEREIPDRREPGKTNKLAGWLTTPKSRNLLFTELRKAVREDRCQIKALDTLRECLTLTIVRNENKGAMSRLERIEARSGCHDDGPMAHGIAIIMRNRVAPVDETQVERKPDEPIPKMVQQFLDQFEREGKGGRIPLQHRHTQVSGIPLRIDGRRSVL